MCLYATTKYFCASRTGPIFAAVTQRRKTFVRKPRRGEESWEIVERLILTTETLVKDGYCGYCEAEAGRVGYDYVEDLVKAEDLDDGMAADWMGGFESSG